MTCTTRQARGAAAAALTARWLVRLQVPAPGLPLWLVPNNTQVVAVEQDMSPASSQAGGTSPQAATQLVAHPGMMGSSAAGEQVRSLVASSVTPRQGSASQLMELPVGLPLGSVSMGDPRLMAGHSRRSKRSLLGLGSRLMSGPPGAAPQQQQQQQQQQQKQQQQPGSPPLRRGSIPRRASSPERPGMWENDTQLEARISRHRRNHSGGGSLVEELLRAGGVQGALACLTPVDPGEWLPGDGRATCSSALGAAGIEV
jgi:hypothetical protein